MYQPKISKLQKEIIKWLAQYASAPWYNRPNFHGMEPVRRRVAAGKYNSTINHTPAQSAAVSRSLRRLAARDMVRLIKEKQWNREVVVRVELLEEGRKYYNRFLK